MGALHHPGAERLENRILGAHDKSIALESKLFEELRQYVAAQLPRVQTSAKAVAVLDVPVFLCGGVGEKTTTPGL